MSESLKESPINIKNICTEPPKKISSENKELSLDGLSLNDKKTNNKESNNKESNNKEPKWTTKKILENVGRIINRSKDPLLIELKSNKLLYLDKIINENQEFFDVFPNIVYKAAMGMTDADINQLAEILVTNDLIREGKISKAKGEFIFGKKLAEKHAPHLLDKNAVCPD